MADNKRQANPRSTPDTGLGLSDYSMSSVRSTETKDATEFSFRFRRLLGWVLVLVLMSGGVVWWFRAGRDLFWQPSLEDRQFLSRLSQLPTTQGVAEEFAFEGRNTLAFEFARGVSVYDKDQARGIREAMRALVAAFSNHRPGALVAVKGYEQGQLVAEGLLRESKTEEEVSRSDASIWVHLEGEEKGIGDVRTFE